MHSSNDVPLFLLTQLINECKHLEINKGDRCTSSYRTNKLVDKQAILLRSIRDRRKREHTWYADRVCDRVYHDPLTGRVHRFNFNLRVSVAAILVYNVSFHQLCCKRDCIVLLQEKICLKLFLKHLSLRKVPSCLNVEEKPSQIFVLFLQ